MKRFALFLFAAFGAFPWLGGCGSTPLAQAASLIPAVTSDGASPTPGPAIGEPAKRAKVHTELAALYFQDGNMAVALDELNKATEADSGYAPAYNMLGLVHMDLHENGEAEQNFRRALSLTPNAPEVNNNFGWFLCQNGREKESIAYFLAAVKDPLYRTPDLALVNAGKCLDRVGDAAGAENYFQKAMRYSRNNPQAMLGLANLYFKQGSLGQAQHQLNAFNQVSDPTPQSLDLSIQLARKSGDREGEASYISQLRRRFPDSKEALSLLRGDSE